MRNLNATVVRSHKYAVLLTLMVVGLAVQSFDARGGGLGESLSDFFRTALGVAIFFVVFERPRERAAVAAILVISLAIGWGIHFSTPSLVRALSLALHALTSLFLWIAVWVILRDLFGKPLAGAENVLGAICGYLIAGDAWAGVHALTYLLAPAAYSVNAEVNALLVEWHGRMAVFSYYALTQMLTVGYSDVTPVRAPATTLTLLTTLFGVFYSAVVVSQVVGMAQSRKDGRP